MKEKQYQKELIDLIKAHRERAEKPRVEKLNKKYEIYSKAVRSEMGDFLKSQEELGFIHYREKLLIEWEKRQKESEELKKQKIPARPKWLVSSY